MSVNATEAVTNNGLYQSPATTSKSDSDKEMFLNLLVAQLRYQDPMNPADSGEFLAQSAQFTSLEKMEAVADQTAALLATSVSFGASNMVGKNVTYLDEDGKSVSGVVDSVSFDVTGPMLQIGGEAATGDQSRNNAHGSSNATDGTQAPTNPSRSTDSVTRAHPGLDVTM
jgi:flagellar basal-body rod modification protein FlgD